MEKGRRGEVGNGESSWEAVGGVQVRVAGGLTWAGTIVSLVKWVRIKGGLGCYRGSGRGLQINLGCHRML